MPLSATCPQRLREGSGVDPLSLGLLVLLQLLFVCGVPHRLA